MQNVFSSEPTREDRWEILRNATNELCPTSVDNDLERNNASSLLGKERGADSDSNRLSWTPNVTIGCCIIFVSLSIKEEASTIRVLTSVKLECSEIRFGQSITQARVWPNVSGQAKLFLEQDAPIPCQLSRNTKRRFWSLVEEKNREFPFLFFFPIVLTAELSVERPVCFLALNRPTSIVTLQRFYTIHRFILPSIRPVTIKVDRNGLSSYLRQTRYKLFSL